MLAHVVDAQDRCTVLVGRDRRGDARRERARVRDALPNVLVPEWPSDKLLYERALTELTCFDTVTLTEEDQSRTRMYVAERERTEAKSSAQSLDAFLSSLGLTVTVERLR